MHIRSNLSLLSLLFIGILSSACRKEAGFEQPVIDNIQLDKTILGVSTVADSLEVPWEITWGPDDWIWFTEQKGRVSRVHPQTGEKQVLLTIDSVWMKRTSGLLGMVVHPDQSRYPYVYVNYTLERDGQHFSRLERYKYQNDTLINPTTILEIPGGTAHNGSRLAFWDEETLLWATGDIAKDGNAQDSTHLNGKILRMDLDGNVPADNPLKDSYVYAWGFRNIQGLVRAPSGILYSAEHGDAIEDEVNLIMPARNYGWQNIEGFHDQDYEIAYAKKRNTVEPMYAWTPTIAPAGLDYYGSDRIPEWTNTLLLTTLKGESLRVLKLNSDGTKINSEAIYLEDQYGRIRDLCISPSGDVYISTSNRDWNPNAEPQENDDRILRITPVDKATHTPLYAKDEARIQAEENTGEVLYQKYCLSCHKLNGKGVPGTFPALVNSKVVENKEDLIPFVLQGSQAEVAMPAFNFLSNEDLAKILQYVRGKWTSKTDSIAPETIETYR